MQKCNEIETENIEELSINKNYIGSSVEDWLREEGFLDDVKKEAEEELRKEGFIK